LEFAKQLFSSDFLPHGTCYLWNPKIVWLHVISDSVITLAYYCIPVALVYLVRKRRDLPFNWIFWMFGLFILGCGTTHLMEVWTVWHGSYLVAGVIKAFTAMVSVATAIVLIPLVPRIISLPAQIHLQEANRKLEVAITEREQAAEARGRLAAVVESSEDAIISKTLKGTITAWNPGAERLFGYSASEAVGKPMRMLLPRELANEEDDILARIGRGARVEHFETVRVRKDGRRIDVSVTISPIKDSLGQIVGASNIARDITERRRSEVALQESLVTRERVLKELADQKFALDQHAIVAITDVQGTITYVNDKFCAISKYSREELIGQNHRILNSGQHPKEFFQQMYRSIANGKVWHDEIKNRAKDGSLYWVDTTVVPFAGKDGKPRQYVAIRADITERKLVEEALKESFATSERALKELADQKFALDQHAIVAVTDVQGTITYVNQKFCAISKYSKEELIGQNHRILNSGHHSKEFFQNMFHTVAKGKVWHDEIKNRAKDGSLYWVDTTIVPFLGAEGKPRQYVAIRADITERKLAEKALRESEERFQAMANGIQQLAWMAEPDGSVFWYNQRWYEYTGTTFEQMQGSARESVHDPDVLPKVLSGWKKAIAASEPFDMEFPLRGVDGRFRMFLTRVMPVRNTEGRVVRWFGTNTDISERKQAEEKLAEQTVELARSQKALESQTLMLRSVLDSMAEGLVAVDENGKFVIWNPVAKKILGLGAADLPSQEWTGYYGLYMADMVTPFPADQIPLVRAIRGEASITQMFVRNPELGDGNWIEVTAGPLRDKQGVVRGGVAAFRDVTQRKAAEREIRELNNELEERVIRRTAQLEAANQELEAFTYSVSHDLRAPLRHIAGFSKMLAEESEGSLKPDAQHYLQKIQDATRRMGTLVDDLLNLARIGRHELRVQVTGLDSIVRDVITDLAPDLEGRKVEWKIGKLPYVEGDPALLKVVFQNLLSNAVKYTRTRANAMIEVSVDQIAGEQVVCVRDNGVGFNMNYADKLFGVFQRLHRAEDFEGTGVGLATTQRIVQKHGGRIWAEAELDKGAVFYVSLGDGKHEGAESKAAIAGETS
jgi:PAS domain S-box-containing protein